MFAEDLKRSVALLEKDKESLETQTNSQLEELKRDKMTLREFLDIKEKTIEENLVKQNQLEQQATELMVQIAQQKQKYDKQISELKQKVQSLQTTIDANKAKHEANKHSLSNEKSHRHQFQKLQTDNAASATGNAVLTGSAKNNSRSINSMSRQMSKQQIIAASGASSGNRNSGSQILFSNGPNKTPIGGAGQMSTSVTTGSQKHLHLNS